MMKNHVREDLQQQGYTIGSWLVLASPLAAEVMASVGFRWLCIDAEHAPVGIAQIAHLARAIESRGATALVRVPDHDASTIARVLDAGVMGIVVPHVQSGEQASAIADAARYPPRGRRSAGSGRAATVEVEDLNQTNDRVLVVAQVEDRQGVDQIDEILSVDGIDIGFLGPKDLAVDLQVSSDADELEAAQQRVLESCRRHGKPAGIPIKNAEEFQYRRKQGYAFFDLTNDLRLLQGAAKKRLEDCVNSEDGGG